MKIDYASQPLNGHFHGAGWTTGTYLGWKPLPNLRFETGLAYSTLQLNGVAGSASGCFPGYRMLATAGLIGNYKVTSQLVDPGFRAAGNGASLYRQPRDRAKRSQLLDRPRQRRREMALSLAMGGFIGHSLFRPVRRLLFFEGRRDNSPVNALARRRIAARDVRPDGRDGQRRPNRRWRRTRWHRQRKL